MELREMALFTGDVDAMASFYGQLFDEEPTVRADGIAIFDVGGVRALIHEQVDSGPDDPPNEDHFSFAVADVDRSFDRLIEGGLDAIREPDDYDWGRSGYLRDPDGRLVELAEE